MIDTPTSQNQTDFRQRYTSSYGWLLKEDGRKILVYLQDFRRGVLQFTDESGMGYHTKLDSGVQFEFLPVQRGWYTHDDGLVYMSRVPARQYCRAINESNTSITAYDSNGLFLSSKISFAILESIFLIKEDFKKNISAFNNKETKCLRLSKHFAIVGNDIMFHQDSVGTLAHENTIKLKTTIIQQELSDTIRRLGANFVLKVG